MYDSCNALVIDECLDAVSDESLDGFKVWTCDQVLPGLKSGELQRCSESVLIGSFFPGVNRREKSAELERHPRIFGEWKDKTAAWHKLKGSEEF